MAARTETEVATQEAGTAEARLAAVQETATAEIPGILMAVGREVLTATARRAIASLPDHGTAVAALLVGRRDSQPPGLVPDAQLVAVDAFYRDGGTADRTDVTSLVTAIEALAEHGVRVINMGLSRPANEVLQKAIAAAQASIVVVAAAGNNGADTEPSYPGAYPGVFAVTVVDHDLNVYRRATRGRTLILRLLECMSGRPRPRAQDPSKQEPPMRCRLCRPPQASCWPPIPNWT